MKRTLILFPVLLTVVMLFTLSCAETKETDDHANWKERNTDFINNIAANCGNADPESATEGQSFRLLSFTDTISPNYTDSVRINYRVRLIPTDNYPEGQVVDQSFKTDNLDPTVNIPYSFRVSGLIEGVTTALMHMHCGDYWKLYIPYGMAYGTSDKGTIPAYSALIFEINLTETARTGQSLSPR